MNVFKTCSNEKGVILIKKTLSFIFMLFLVFILSISATAAQYVVQPGDSMWLIAQKFGISVSELSAANPQIKDPSNIIVGQTINIPGDNEPSVITSLTYLYGGTTDSYLRILDKTDGAIDTVCTDYFDIDAKGQLLITPSDKINEDFIREMHRRNISVTPFISNHWDRDKGNAALNNREALSTKIAEMIEKYNLDGINIDIENVNEQYKDAYTDFTRLLRRKLPADKLVTVAVAANPKSWNTGWHGSYDYKALSDNSDYLMIMAYDESYYAGPAGPISSSQFFESSIKYAMNSGVPKSKIVTGIPFFGRYWKDGEDPGGIGITANDTEYLIQNYQSSTSYNTTTQSAKAIVTIKESDPKPMIWGGRVLGAGTYHIWYDSTESVKHKLSMLQSYGIRGVGSWALGQENPEIWLVYKDILNIGVAPPTIPEPEVPPKQSSLEKIQDILKSHGVDRNVHGGTDLTRGEYAVILAGLANLKPEPQGETFADTQNYWGKGYLNALKRRGIIYGTGNNLYNPNLIITREEICALLERILVLPNTIDFHGVEFKDVRPTMWSYNSIMKMNYFGLVVGYNNKFMPFNRINASTFALILDRIDKFDYPINADKYLSYKQIRGRVQYDPIFGEPIIDPR